MVGYAPNAYHLWNPEKRELFLTRDVKFDESFATETRDETPLVVIPHKYEAQKKKQCEHEEEKGGVGPGAKRIRTKDDEMTNDENFKIAESGALLSQNEPWYKT